MKHLQALNEKDKVLCAAKEKQTRRMGRRRWRAIQRGGEKTCPILLVQWNSNLMTNFCLSFKKLWICHNPISMPCTTRFRRAMGPSSNRSDAARRHGQQHRNEWECNIEREENSIKLSANLQDKLKRIWNLAILAQKRIPLHRSMFAKLTLELKINVYPKLKAPQTWCVCICINKQKADARQPASAHAQRNVLIRK